MRKLLTILVIILILFSGVTINLAFHYCGGRVVEKKISLTDIHTSCGMEGDTQHKNADISSLCCSDKVSSYTFNNLYLSSLGAKEEAIDVELPVLEVFSISIADASYLIHEEINSPPGLYSPSFVDLDSICILRI